MKLKHLSAALTAWIVLAAVACGLSAVGSGDAARRAAIKSGAAAIGITAESEIVVPDRPDIVEETAAETMRRFLRLGGVNAAVVRESSSTAARRIVLGRVSNSPIVKHADAAGTVRVGDIDPADDGFHLVSQGRDVIVAGANPRGVLYGVYALEEFIESGTRGKLNLRRIPSFRKRASGAALSHIGIRADQVMGKFTEADAIALSRLGINELTDQAIGGTLSEFVTSEVFPFIKEPSAEFQRHLKEMSAICRKYGIDQYVFLNEPALPSLMGDLSRFPAEALGTARRPWGGGPGGLDRTLCVSSGLGQRFLRDAMARFVREYPDIKGVQFYNLDVSAWLCTPSQCERCRKVCTESPPDAFNPSETQARLVELLAGAAHDERPGFQFRFWAAVHYHGRQFDNLVKTARGHDALLSSWTGSDRTVMIPDAAAPDERFSLSRQAAEREGIDFLALCEFHNLEIIPRSLPFPFHVVDALQKYRKWGVNGFTEIFGVQPTHSTVNAVAAREFFWNPDMRPEDFLRQFADGQVGPQAGASLYRSWEEMRRAFDVWDVVRDEPFPLEGSQFHVKIGPAIGGLPPSLAPDGAKQFGEIIDILTKVEPWRDPGFEWNKSEDYEARMRKMLGHLEAAAALARRAVEDSSPTTRVAVHHTDPDTERPTAREYAELNYAPIAFGAALSRERCAMIRGYHLVTERDAAKAGGDAKLAERKEQEYRQLVRASMGTLQEFRTLIEGFAKMKPTFERTALTERDIESFLARTDEKLGKLKAYLGES